MTQSTCTAVYLVDVAELRRPEGPLAEDLGEIIGVHHLHSATGHVKTITHWVKTRYTLPHRSIIKATEGLKSAETVTDAATL